VRRRALLAVLLAGCAPPCLFHRRSELYLGLRRADGTLVARQELEAFVANEVVPTLPSGFTLYEAEGRWVADGKDEREPSRVLVVLHRGDPRVEAGLEQVRARYKQRFAQQAVLRADSATCVRR
jgi:hypothetical protein